MKKAMIPFELFWDLDRSLIGSILVYPGEPTMIRFELPDKIYGFKTATIKFDTMEVMERTGFSDDEMAILIQKCQNNAKKVIPAQIRRYCDA